MTSVSLWEDVKSFAGSRSHTVLNTLNAISYDKNISPLLPIPCFPDRLMCSHSVHSQWSNPWTLANHLNQIRGKCRKLMNRKQCPVQWTNSFIMCLLAFLPALGFPCGSAGKESACNAGDLGLIPGLVRSPGEGKAYPLQYSGLENSMDYIVLGAAKSQTRLSNFHFDYLHFPDFWHQLLLFTYIFVVIILSV